MDASHIRLSDQWSLTNPTVFDAFWKEWQIVKEPPPPSIDTRPIPTAQTPTRSKKRKPVEQHAGVTHDRPPAQPQAHDTSHAQASEAPQNNTPERGIINSFLKEAVATARGRLINRLRLVSVSNRYRLISIGIWDIGIIDICIG